MIRRAGPYTAPPAGLALALQSCAIVQVGLCFLRPVKSCWKSRCHNSAQHCCREGGNALLFNTRPFPPTGQSSRFIWHKDSDRRALAPLNFPPVFCREAAERGSPDVVLEAVIEA